MTKFHTNVSMFRQARKRTNALGIRDDNYCAVLAYAQATNVGYSVAYETLQEFGREHGKGFHRDGVTKLMESIGAEWVWMLPKGTMTIREFTEAFPLGNYYVSLDSHACAVVDGIVLDNFFNVGRIVYSAWKMPL